MIEFKRTIPILGFLPSEIRFWNGNGDNGNDGVDGSYGGAGAGEGGPIGGATGFGGAVSGPSGEIGAEPSGLNDAFNPPTQETPFDIETAPYTPPSTYPDLSEAFAPPKPFDIEMAQYTPPLSFETEAKITGTTLSTTPKSYVMPKPGLTKGWASFIGDLFDITLGGIFSFVQGAQIAGFFVRAGEKATKIDLSKEITKALEGFFQPVRGTSLITPTEAEEIAVQPAQPTPTPTPSRSAQNQTPISLADYSGSLGAGISSIPTTFESAVSKSTYPSLSTSLFTIQKKEEGEGLMIFPTSTKDVEKEGSSLLGTGKKQEPVIDSKSILFLLGMGAVGMILRKTMK